MDDFFIIPAWLCTENLNVLLKDITCVYFKQDREKKRLYAVDFQVVFHLNVFVLDLQDK